MEGNVMKRPLGEEMEFFRQYNEVLFNQLEKKILDKETANQQLRISVKEYRLQFKNISDVVFMIGTDFNISSISPSVEKLLGYKAEDFIGRPASDLRHIFTSGYFERAIANISRMLKGERIPVAIYAVTTKDGTLKHIEVHGSPLIRDGKVAGTISVARDVTERKQAEEALHNSEQRLASIYNAVGDVIFYLAVEPAGQFRFVSVNSAFLKVTGLSPEMVVGRTVNEIIPEPSLTMVLGKYRQAIAENTIVRWEEISDYPTGRLTGIVSIAPIFDDKGTCTHLVGSVQDITDRKLMEEELRESEEKYHELVKYAPAGIYEYDYETNLFTSVNDVICEYTGYTRDELLTTNFFNILTEESKKLMLARLEKLMANELSIKQAEVQTVEYCIRKKGGEELWVRLSARYIYESGKLKGSTGVVYNITDRKQAEDMLKESEKKYRELSIIDDLSQLYNSRHFHAQIEIEIERSNRYGQPLTLLLLDLDKFKKFNDKYGHVEGDYVLSRLGQVIKRCLRETDSAYRYGGEEFTIMLPMTTSEEGIVTAKRIQTELRKETFYPVLGQEVNITVSIGLAQYKTKEETKAFVQRVDKLMYQAKKDGRNRICPDRIIHKHRAIGSS
jgi:diguanylate cyclase (GGDEF)-like protein/PAS domain S-box-containing protein